MEKIELSLILVFGIFFFCCVGFSLLINGLFLKFAKTLGMRHLQENMIRWSPLSKPSLGGISFYIVFLLSFSALAVFSVNESGFLSRDLIGLLLAVTLGFLAGLADDAYDTNPLLKAFAQFTCANILISMGIYIEISPYMSINYFFTILWVVGMMNSINMLDNMDGIAAIVSSTAIISALIVITANNDSGNIYLFILLGALASLTGFLFYNWYPSRIYMGDTGSQFLGVFLAAVGIIFFWNIRDPSAGAFQIKQFLSPLIVFTVPILDTTTVIIHRMIRNRSPFVGGKDHITHHLVYLGLPDKLVALVVLVVSLVSTIIFWEMYGSMNHWKPAYTWVVLSYFAVILALTNWLYEKGRKKILEEPGLKVDSP